MREAFFGQLYRLMEADDRIMLLLGDVGAFQVDKLRESFPHRVINMGIAEENMMGVAAGLAMSKKIPFVFTHAIFATISGFEQIRLDICAHNLPVKIVGCGPGLDYANLGPSHHATEDIALMRVLPNMTIFSPCDNIAASAFVKLLLDTPGPVYIRLDRRGEPLVYKDGSDFSDGFSIVREGKNLSIVATGKIVIKALAMAEENDASVIDLYRIKPLPKDKLLSALHNQVITLEEHNVIGGIGSAIAEILAESRCGLVRKGINDEFCFKYGSREYLWEKVIK